MDELNIKINGKGHGRCTKFSKKLGKFVLKLGIPSSFFGKIIGPVLPVMYTEPKGLKERLKGPCVIIHFCLWARPLEVGKD